MKDFTPIDKLILAGIIGITIVLCMQIFCCYATEAFGLSSGYKEVQKVGCDGTLWTK